MEWAFIKNDLCIGKKAPHFSLPDAENRTRNLKEFLGQKVVLVFFVHEFTVTCTKEVCEFRDSMDKMINLEAQIVGVDTTDPSTIKVCAEKNRFAFPILSDQKHEVARIYGVTSRAIFVLDQAGSILYKWVAQKPEDEPDYNEINRYLKPSAPKKEAQMVAPTVVTFSRQIGSGGDEIAQYVSQMLGWPCVDKALVVEIGRSLGYHEEDIVDFCEDTYRVQSLIDKLMLRRKPSKMPFIAEGNVRIREALDEEQCLVTIQTVIKNLASRGNVVIVGRGGQAILKHKVGVLNVRIIAPQAIRVQRIISSMNLTEAEALKVITENDKAGSEYLQRFYGIDWDDPANYDIVLNTAKLDLSTAALMISSVASQA
ncbi:redoxin domain-containing protein [Candidatus Bathyarchaeota archaeon]|nr:redoxin domain-containing protein [Candidatus Bathyarchaeota archaeon]